MIPLRVRDRSRTLRSPAEARSVKDRIARYRKSVRKRTPQYCTAKGIVGGRTVDRIVDLFGKIFVRTESR